MRLRVPSNMRMHRVKPRAPESVVRISVELPDAKMRRLEEKARRFRVSPGALAGAVLQDLIGQDDKDFAKVADFVVKKNAVLLRRLA